MTHLQIPITDSHHLTLAHFHKPLTAEQGATVIEGIEHLNEVFRDITEVNMWWGFNDLMVGPRSNVLASSVELETDIIPRFRQRLVAGLIARGLPVSQDYAEWLPHITNPPASITTWTWIRHRGILVLVQGQHRVEIPFLPNANAMQRS